MYVHTYGCDVRTDTVVAHMLLMAVVYAQTYQTFIAFAAMYTQTFVVYAQTSVMYIQTHTQGIITCTLTPRFCTPQEKSIYLHPPKIQPLYLILQK